MNNFIKNFTNKKRNLSQNVLKGNEEELAQFNSDTSTATATNTTPSTSAESSSSSQDAGPLLLIDVIVNESSNPYETEIKKLFKDIEDLNQDDASLIKKLESLLREDGKNFERISDAKTGNENFNLLHYAAKTNRPSLCAFFIDELNIDIDSQTKTKSTPLHLLIKHFDSSLLASSFLNDEERLRESLQVFFERNPNLNLVSDQQQPLIHLAISKQNQTAVQMLLNQPKLNLYLKDTSKMIPLRAACQLNNEDILNMIIDKTSSDHLLKDCQLLHLICGSKLEKLSSFRNALLKLKPILNIQLIINSLDDQNKTVLELAIENNHLKIVDFILGELTDKDQFDSNGNLPVHLVAKHATSSLFDLLLKHSCISFKSNLLQQDNPLHIAAKYNKFNFIKQIINFEKSFIDKLETSSSSYVPMVKCFNKKLLTPLQISLVKNYKKCVDELLQCNHIDLECVDASNYSIYHLCIKYSNLESLRSFLNKKSEKFYQPLLIRTKLNETPLHLACQLGNLEAFKQIMIKIKNTNAQSLESYLKLSDLNNRNCFHIACLYNHYNIVEYVLKDLQMRFFLELTDSDMNTCLLIAADNGYSKLAYLLVDYGADLNANNKDLRNAYEVALLKGNYETCKYLISSDSIRGSSLHMTVSKNCPHLLELLLSKGADLDTLNKNKENSLDIALNNSSYECIQVMLKNTNWYKLFDNPFRKDSFLKESFILNEDSNRQINGLFIAKQYDLIEIILDNCKLNSTTYDFSILDVKRFSSLNEHPLMRLAQSGQENLLKHETTKMLIHLKWTKLPRVIFYFNLLLHLFFLILFSLYSIDLVYVSQTNKIDQIGEFNSAKSKRNLETTHDFTKYYSLLILLISLHLFKISLVLVNSCRFLFRLESWLEIVSLVTGLISLNSNLMTHKLTFSSICLATGYIHFILLFQMIQLVGLYVIAFKHCFIQTLKLLPLFCTIYLSFNLTNTFSPVETFNLNETKLDLFQTRLSQNDLILILLTLVLVNLCIGIAVNEINNLMSKALNEQITKKLIFVLRVQNGIRFLNKNKYLKKVFNMTFTQYTNKSFKLSSLFKCLVLKQNNKTLLNKFKREQETPNNQLVPYTGIVSKLNDLELNLSNRQKRLEDSLAELERVSLNSFDVNQQISLEKLNTVENSFVKSQVELRNSLFDLKNYVILKFSSLKQSLVQTVRNFEYDSFEQNLKLLTSLDSIHEKINYVTDNSDSIKQVERDEFKLISNNFLLIDSRLSMFQIELERLVKKMESVESQITVSDYKLNVIDIMVRKETFSAKLEQVISKLDDLNDRQFSVEKTLAKLNYDSK